VEPARFTALFANSFHEQIIYRNISFSYHHRQNVENAFSTFYRGSPSTEKNTSYIP